MQANWLRDYEVACEKREEEMVKIRLVTELEERQKQQKHIKNEGKNTKWKV